MESIGPEDAPILDGGKYGADELEATMSGPGMACPMFAPALVVVEPVTTGS
ncbi:hypothetical protein [Mariluticola halotolerans]|uniref:hypothetical protein n=1 Tax=Mariluticola halotolerans TaxID=2909283 RepID=UPI0026E13F63|nr:hypothetical protein [Mariluticola halotolerans]UJQ95063.1 hypothetical protein L1P08_03495 [Mariluticola halotolerans]